MSTCKKAIFVAMLAVLGCVFVFWSLKGEALVADPLTRRNISGALGAAIGLTVMFMVGVPRR